MMKKIFSLIFCVLLLGGGAIASPVGAGRARRVAEGFMRSQGMAGVKMVDLSATLPFRGIYLFGGQDGGFVLVSGDDCATPILGYSLQGSFDVENIPANVRQVLESYESEIGALAGREQRRKPFSTGRGAAQDAVSVQWQRFEDEGTPPEPLIGAVLPLLTTTWNQYPYYNELCPYDSVYSERVVTGCVATAMSQVMRYWCHPATGYGSHSYHAGNSHSDYGTLTADFGATNYDWLNMPMSLSATSSAAQVNAVATLMYHAGVALEMEYNVADMGGSAAYNTNFLGEIYLPSAQAAFNAYFKYRPDMVAMMRDDWGDSVFCARLRNELAQQRPILIDGFNASAGHSFLLDGFDNNGLFHVNWGWGGVYDGYYVMGVLNPGQINTPSSTFNRCNSVVLGIRPNAEWDSTATTTVNLTVANGNGTLTGSGTYAFGDTITIKAHAAAGFRFDGWTDGDNHNPRQFMANGGTYNFSARFVPVAGDTICFFPGNSYLGMHGEEAGGDIYWGIHIPSTLVDPATSLSAVMLYVLDSGQYDLTVYTGVYHDHASYSETLLFGHEDEDSWQTIHLATPVVTNEDIWIIFRCSDANYPAAVTYSGADEYAAIYGEDFYDISDQSCSFMVKALFEHSFNANGDTISYVGDRQLVTDIRIDGETPFHWGIKIPSTAISGRNYLASVMLYADMPDVYHMKIYRGGDTVPGTLIHSQDINVMQAGWYNAVLDATVSLPAGQNLWVIFSSPYAPAADYTGQADGDWLSLDGSLWEHCSDYGISGSWMVKCVTATNLPPLPPPVVSVMGPRHVAIDENVTLHAVGTADATIHWEVEGGFPTQGEGDSITVSFANAGIHEVVATISNVYGSSSDTLRIEAINYSLGDTISYCREAQMDTAMGIGLGTTLTFRWGIMLPAAYLEGRDSLKAVQLYLNTSGNYTLTVSRGGTTAPGTPVYSSSYSLSERLEYNTCLLDSAIAIDATQNLWITFEASGVDYPASGCSYTGDVNSDWVSVGNNPWMHLSEQLPYSWMIRCVTTTGAPIVRYLVTVESCDTAMGTVDGGGVFRAGDTARIVATPRIGYVFVRWSDGSIMASRQVVVRSNAHYLALFAPSPNPFYTVTVASADSLRGSVTGGGVFEEGSVITISAIAAEGYRFDHWNDLDTHATRTVRVMSNISYTAYFRSLDGIDEAEDCRVSLSLWPNPASESVQVHIEGLMGKASLSIIDLYGRVVLCADYASDHLTLPLDHLAPGTYLLRLETGEGVTTRKLVVKP